MDFELTPEQREIEALARDVARAEIDPYAADWDREHRFPAELYPKLAELGLMGVCVPEEYGGAGADYVSYILVLEELSRADADVGVGRSRAACRIERFVGELENRRVSSRGSKYLRLGVQPQMTSDGQRRRGRGCGLDKVTPGW